MIDFGAFDALTFDCYGTLIDWETGIAGWLRPFADAPDDALLESFARHEAELEAARTAPTARCWPRRCGAWGRTSASRRPTSRRPPSGPRSAIWPAFPDSADALAALKRRFRLGVITNCDDDLFALSNRRLGVEFDWVITAQQARGYKPRAENFSSRSSASTCRGSGSCTSPRACSTTTCRPRRSA